MKWLILILLVAMGYIRFAPSDPTRWHRPVEGQADRDWPSGVLRLTEASLADLDAVARDWPRTKLLAGSVDEGRVTYITRTALWGFPDYTTVEARETGSAIYARLRFGRSDFGVNGRRVSNWLAALR